MLRELSVALFTVAAIAIFAHPQKPGHPKEEMNLQERQSISPHLN